MLDETHSSLKFKTMKIKKPSLLLYSSDSIFVNLEVSFGRTFNLVTKKGTKDDEICEKFYIRLRKAFHV